MTPARRMPLIVCAVLIFLAGGCSLQTGNKQDANAPQQSAQENLDPSCAYLQFLLGSRAEYDQKYDIALEAYRKAVACDPTAQYIYEKIPILMIKTGKLKEAEQWLQTFVAEHPDENSQRLLLAEIDIHNNNLPEAVRLYQEALNHDPGNEAILLRLGLLYSQQRDYPKAEQTFLKLLQMNDKSYFANLYLARIYSQTGEYDKAAAKYETVLALNWSKELALEVAEFYNQQKNYAKALLLYKSILATDKHNEQATLGVIQTLLAMDLEKQAMAELAKLRSFSRQPEKIDIIESQIYMSRGKIAAAEKLLQSILRKKKSSHAEYLLAIVYLEEKKPDAALRILKSIGPQADEYESGLILQIRTLKSMNRLPDAIDLLKKIIADQSTRKPIYYALLSSLYQEIPDMQQGLDILKEGIGQYPNNAQLLFELAIFLEKDGRHDEAVSTMEKVLQLQPDNPEALNFVGYSWADESRNLDQALTYIKRAVAQKPTNGFIRDSLGWAYYRLGDFIRSVEELERAVSLETHDPHIFDHLGDAYKAMGQIDKAVAAYSKALELATTEKDRDTFQQKIQNLKNTSHD